MKLIIFIVFILSILSLTGCGSFQPVVDVYKNSALNAVYHRDEGLAVELSRIPGVNTPDSPYQEEVKALFSDYRSGRYGDAFLKILSIGNREARAYAPVLEALLWLYHDDRREADSLLVDFEITRLLEASWGDCEGTRWDEWEEVRPRLTSPILAGYFTGTALKYIPERADGKNYLQSPYETLLMGGGDCEDFAVLIVEALEFGGYYARLFTVDIWTKDGKINKGTHTVATYREGGMWYFIQGFDGKYLKGEITGPFDTPLAMAEHIAERIDGAPLYYYVDTIIEFIRAYEPLNRGRQ